MVATTTTELTFSASASAIPVNQVGTRRRRVSPQAGRALEKLGHAIEYLSAEFVNDDGPIVPHSPELEAVQLLMALNRRIYFECPEAPSLRERLVAFFRRTA